MNNLIFILVLSSFQYGNLAHLHGYYTQTESGYSFKHCYEDEVRTIIQKDDINLVIDYLEEKHDTKFSRTKSGLINVWESENIAIVGITRDYVNYIIEVNFYNYGPRLLLY